MLALRFRWFFILFLGFCVAHTNADVFKWVDSSGRVTYSDLPQDTKAERLSIKSAPTDHARLSQNRQNALDAKHAAAAEAQEQAEQRGLDEKNSEISAENCRRAQNAFNSLINPRRLYVADEKGDRHYLNEAEIADRRTRAQKDVKEWCVKK